MKSQTFNISLPQELVKKADQVAAKEFRNRSELIKEALRTYIQSQEEWDQLFESGKEVGKLMNIKSEEEVWDIIDNARHGKA